MHGFLHPLRPHTPVAKATIARSLQHRGRVRLCAQQAAASASPLVDLYSVLGVPRDANEMAIKSAYRQAVRQWHPDLFQNKPDMQAEAAARLQALNHAYDVLGDIHQRQVYDGNYHAVQATEAAYAAARDRPGMTEEALEALRESMERAQQAMAEAVRARTRARDLHRERGAKIKGSRRARSHSPGASSPGASQADLPPLAAKAAQAAVKEAKRAARSERRATRRHAAEARAWAQWAEYHAAQLQQEVARQCQQQSDDPGADVTEPLSGVSVPVSPLQSQPAHSSEGSFGVQTRRGKHKHSSGQFIWPGDSEETYEL